MLKGHTFKPALLTLSSAFVLCGCSGEDTEEPAGGTEPEAETEEETEANTQDDSTEEVDEKASGGEIRVAYSAQPSLLDVHENTEFASSDIMRHVYEPLVTMDSEYNVVPMLADSYEQSEDGTEITFDLREGVLFHNGEEMNAEDVVASMDKWSEGSGARGQFDEATFEAEGDYTVVLNLPDPSSTVLPLLAGNATGFPAIMPKEIVDEAGADGVSEYIGTGPFQFEDWQTDQEVHLSKFEDHQPLDQPADGLAGAREALVDDIYFEFVLDPSTRMSGMQTREYDIAHSIPYDSAEQLETDENLINHPYPQSVLNIHFNKSSGMFTDEEARRAVGVSLDMESILQAAYSNEEYYTLNHNIMMEHQLEQWNSDIGADQYNQNNPEPLQNYLDEIDYNGEEITLLATRDYEDHYNAAVVVQQQLEQHGLNVNLEVYEWATLLDLNKEEEGWEMYMMGNSPKPEPTSIEYFDPSYAGWTEVPEDLITDFRQQPSIEDGIEMYDELQEWFYDYRGTIKVGDFKRIATLQSSVDNFQYQDGFMLWNTSNNE